MLTETASPGVLTIRATSPHDRNGLAHLAIPALRRGRKVVVLVAASGADSLAFCAHAIGRKFHTYGVQLDADAETPEAAILAGLSGWAKEWERAA